MVGLSGLMNAPMVLFSRQLLRPRGDGLLVGCDCLVKMGQKESNIMLVPSTSSINNDWLIGGFSKLAIPLEHSEALAL